jgi:hypothetical protein
VLRFAVWCSCRASTRELQGSPLQLQLAPLTASAARATRPLVRLFYRYLHVCMAVQLVSCQCLAHGCCACIVHSVCCPPCHANVLYAHRCCPQHIAPVTALHSAREAGPLQDAHSKICNPGPADTGDTMLARKGYAFPMWFRAVTHVWKKPLNCRQTLLAWPQASWSCCSMLVLK